MPLFLSYLTSSSNSNIATLTLTIYPEFDPVSLPPIHRPYPPSLIISMPLNWPIYVCLYPQSLIPTQQPRGLDVNRSCLSFISNSAVTAHLTESNTCNSYKGLWGLINSSFLLVFSLIFPVFPLFQAHWPPYCSAHTRSPGTTHLGPFYYNCLFLESPLRSQSGPSLLSCMGLCTASFSGSSLVIQFIATLAM